MNSRAARIDAGAGVSFIASAVIHLAVFLLLIWGGRLFPPQRIIQETYYVDVVNLPTVASQSGSSAQKTGQEGVETPPAPSPPMVVPSPARIAPKSVSKPAAPSAQQITADTESAFAERLARLESNSEALHEQTVLDKLRSKMKAGSPKVGTPGVGGAEAGSRYADYIKSRLEDALKVTSSYTTRNPEVSVRLTISAEGRLSRIKVERSSGDAAFELAVRRAIDLASEKFTPPPNRAAFENGFVFKPRGISNGPPR